MKSLKDKILFLLDRYKIVIIYLILLIPYFEHSFNQIADKGFFYVDINYYPIIVSVYFATMTLLNNRYKDIGILYLSIVKVADCYYLEISNIGNRAIYDTVLSFNSTFTDSLPDEHKKRLCNLSQKTFSLRKEEVKYLPIGNTIDPEYKISIDIKYLSKGEKVVRTEIISISDFDLGFVELSNNK